MFTNRKSEGRKKGRKVQQAVMEEGKQCRNNDRNMKRMKRETHINKQKSLQLDNTYLGIP